MNINPFALWNALKFVFIAPLILLFLLVINVLTSPSDWWVQWAALGLSIPWTICLLRVLKGALLLGGLAALVTYLTRRS
jgi:hypothetical protein